MTLGKAIKLLEKEYEKAKQLKWVYNPIAYALYKVWKMADEGGKNYETSKNRNL